MKGICTNLDCQNNYADSKVVIDIPEGEDFICPKCGKRLKEYSKAVPWFIRNRLWIIVAALVVIVGVVLSLTINPKKVEEPELEINSEDITGVNQTPDDHEVEVSTQDSLIKESLPGDTVPINIKPDPDTVDQREDVEPVVITNVIEYPFGKYVGDIKFNDKLQKDIPEGSGRMYYYRKTEIAKHHVQTKYFAENGDFLDGTWANGDIVVGCLYKKDGESIKIQAGKRPYPYDLSKD